MNIAKEKRGLFNWRKKEDKIIDDPTLSSEEILSEIKKEQINTQIPEDEKKKNIYTNPRLALDYFKELRDLKEENRRLKNTTLRQKIDQFLQEKGFKDEKLSQLVQEFMER